MVWFRNLRLVYKLAIPSIGLLLIAILIVFVARSAIVDLEENTREIVEVNANRSVLALKLALAVNEAAINERNIIIETDETKMKAQHKRYDEAKQQSLAAIDQLTALAKTPARKQMNLEIRSTIESYFSAADRAIALGLKNENEAASKISFNESEPARLRTVDTAHARTIAIMAELNAAKDHATEIADHSKFTILGVAAIGLPVAFGFFGFIVIFTINRPLSGLVAALRQMAQGFSDAKIPEADRGDEIGEVGRAVDGIKVMVVQKAAEQAAIQHAADQAAAIERKRTMIELADTFESAIGSVIGMVSSSATELQATAGSMSALASQTSAQSGAVAAAAEEAASNVNMVAGAAEELGSSVQEIGRQVGGSAELARQAVSEADRTGVLVHKLAESVSKIGDVIGLISDIAGKTNLLALNATIEAARAGAAGKGFAVVAAEVKALAEQTARATNEISVQITQIQGSTGQAVSAIGMITSRINEISGVATSIAAAVEEQGAATNEIVRNVGQAAAGTSEVTGNIASVANASEETGVAATQVLGAASELSQQAERLTLEVGRFLATVRAA